MSGVELSPGVIVDVERGEAYLMATEGGILAIGLERGQVVWSSDKAAKPLLLTGDLLLGQVEPKARDRALRIASLETRNQGELRVESKVPLPAGVEPLIKQRADRAFVARAQALDGDAALSWEFVDRPLSGLPPGAQEVLPGEEEPAAAPAAMGAVAAIPDSSGFDGGIVTRGAVRLSPGDGTVRPMTESRAVAAPMAVSSAAIGPGSELAVEAGEPGIPDPQFDSADGRHVLHSERRHDDRTWDKYLWQIYEKPSRDIVGEFHTHASFAPFIVFGQRIVYLCEPYQRLVDGQLVDEPLQIRAFDMEAGTQVWQQPVRDTLDTASPPA